MNCELMQRRLLASEAPERPPTDVRAHLDGCPACQEWQRQLLHLEQGLRRLPVPATDAKARLITRIQRGPAGTRATWSHVLHDERLVQKKDRGLLKVSVAFALAASLVLCAFGIMMWKGEREQVQPFVKKTSVTDP